MRAALAVDSHGWVSFSFYEDFLVGIFLSFSLRDTKFFKLSYNPQSLVVHFIPMIVEIGTSKSR